MSKHTVNQMSTQTGRAVLRYEIESFNSAETHTIRIMDRRGPIITEVRRYEAPRSDYYRMAVEWHKALTVLASLDPRFYDAPPPLAEMVDPDWTTESAQ